MSKGIVVLVIILACLFSSPGVLAKGPPKVDAGGFLSVDCGEESFITRLVASPIGNEGSLLWVGGSESSLLIVDRQGLVLGPAGYDFGSVTIGTTVATGLDYFTLVNNGEYSIDVSITATNMTGGVQWVLSNTATPGVDIFGLKAGLDGGDYNITVKDSDGNELVSSLGAGSSQLWGLKLYVPTSFSDGEEKTGTITLTAVLS